MRIPLESPPARRVRPLHVVTTTWLSLISLVVIVDHVALSRLAEDSQATAQSARIAVLEQTLSEWGQRVDAIERRPEALTREGFVDVRRAIEERLARIEQSAADHAAANELALLKERVDRLEARVVSTRQAPTPQAAPTPRPAPTESARPRIVEPPFRLLGAELRAGERFLSIAPAGSRSLAEVRVLRPGESLDGWRLDSLDAHTAVFSFEGQVRQLAVPQALP
jgi:hypothetical protein